ncbi:MAG: hypothetical protein ABI333_22655 [bacterium]
MRTKWIGLLAFSLLLAGCGDDQAECHDESDCPAGQRCVLGECRPAVDQDGALPDGGDARVDAGADAGGDAGADGGDLCEYVDDGVVNRDELVIEVGLGATYRVNQTGPVSVDLVGQDVGGEPLWDYTGTTPSDQSVVDELLPVPGTWYAGDFPDSTYAAHLDDETLGVFRVTDQALAMIGIVSVEPNKTLLTYSVPVDVLRFPIQLGDHYVINTVSSGTFNWTPMWTVEETYDITVDALGTVVVPAGSFHALRIRTNLHQYIPFTLFTLDRILYVYVTECFGIVARLRSEDDETENLFTQAAEYRRMTL